MTFLRIWLIVNEMPSRRNLKSLTRPTGQVVDDRIPDPWAVEKRRTTLAEKPEVLFLSNDVSMGMLSMASVLEHQDRASVSIIPINPDTATMLLAPHERLRESRELLTRLYNEGQLSIRMIYELSGLGESKARTKIVCLTMRSDNITATHNTVLFTKLKCPDADVVVGGPGVTLSPLDALADSGADYAVAGEGERPLAQLVEVLGQYQGDGRNSKEFFKALTNIPGLYFRRGGNVIFSGTENKPLTAFELEHLPLNYGLLSATVHDETLIMITSRSCPYHCLFCAGDKIFGSEFRPWSPERIMSDLRAIAPLEFKRPSYVGEFRVAKSDRFKIEHVFFGDDDFLLRRKGEERALRFFKMFSESELKDRFDFEVQANVHSLMKNTAPDTELIKAMMEAHVKTVYMGAESLSDSFIRRNKIPTLYTAANVRDVCCELRDNGIQPSLNLILSDVDLKPEELRECTSNLKKLASEVHDLRICVIPQLMPFEGTPAFEDRKARGLEKQFVYHDYTLPNGVSGRRIVGEIPTHKGVADTLEELNLAGDKHVFEGREKIIEFCEKLENCLNRHCN